MTRILTSGLAAMAFGFAAFMGGATPASAQLAASPSSLGLAPLTAQTTDVQYRRGGRRGFRSGGFRGSRGYYRSRGYYGRGYYGRGPGPGAIIGGLAAGAIIGGAFASQGHSWSQAEAYCARRFRSWDPASRTYLGYDGLRHSCP